MKKPRQADIHGLLSGGDRRSIADSNRVRTLMENDPSLVSILVALTTDEDWLVVQRALDLLEKLARDHIDWIAPHKKVFVGRSTAWPRWLNGELRSGRSCGDTSGSSSDRRARRFRRERSTFVRALARQNFER